jgi:hypothetical protein
MTSTFSCVKGQSKIRVDFHFFLFNLGKNKTLHPALSVSLISLSGVCVCVCISGRKGGGWGWREMMSFDLITLPQCVRAWNMETNES